MKAITLYGKMLAFSRLKLASTDFDTLKEALGNLQPTNKTVPVVVESDKPLDLESLIDLLWMHKLSVIGVVDGVLNEQAVSKKLAIFPADGTRIEQIQPKVQKSTTNESTAQKNPESTSTAPNDGQLSLPTLNTENKSQDLPKSTPLHTSHTAETVDEPSQGITSIVYEQMLRSGQTVSHFGGDLIITGSVNKGAEVITDNNLHIYGKAGGRLIAGATGDQDARIFCQKFDPTLVSISGTYCLQDDIPAEMLGKAVQVSYDKEKGLVFSLMQG